jgi:hypothetical protein
LVTGERISLKITVTKGSKELTYSDLERMTTEDELQRCKITVEGVDQSYVQIARSWHFDAEAVKHTGDWMFRMDYANLKRDDVKPPWKAINTVMSIAYYSYAEEDSAKTVWTN